MTEHRQRIAVVTGANKGIGFEVARGLAEAGLVVYLGARQPDLGEVAATQLRALGHDVHIARPDVTDGATVTALAERIAAEQGYLDILVNNAAIGLDFTLPSEVTADEMRAVFETNVIGPVRMIQAMLPLLRQSAAGSIVNVSSDFGSLTLNSDPTLPHGQTTALAYTVSKAALNQATVQFAKELRGTDIKINAVDPGFTDTDMIRSVGMRTRRTPAQAAEAIIAMALVGPDSPHGTYSNAAGPLPW
jgi:NAD(P)-dependent dehydrogenase (short-subunit alcohol dehydrogenase family)